MEKKYSNLIKNTLILSIGDFGSKILSFIIVPLYTFLFTTAEFGKIDIFVSIINLMLPFSNIVIYESMIRLLVDKEESDDSVISNCFLVFAYGVAITLLTCPIICNIFQFENLKIIYSLIMIFTIYNSIFSQYFRATGKMTNYSIYGIIYTLIFLICNVIFIVNFKLGMVGYLCSILIAQIVSAIYITIFGGFLIHFHIKKIDYELLKRMIKYTLPLVPNAFMWWVMSTGDKFIINYFLGDSYNGIYSFAIKIPTILSTMYSLFMSAWQLSAIQENNNSKVKEFHNNVFNTVFTCLVLLSSFIAFSSKIIFLYFVSSDFYSSWIYVSFMCVCVVLNCAGSFFGICYTISKNTKNALMSTIYGAIVNLILNCLLINKIGLYGVIIGTAFGYMTILAIRINDYVKMLHINLDIKKTIMTFIIFVFQCFGCASASNDIIYLVINLLCLSSLLLINYKEIIVLINKTIRR